MQILTNTFDIDAFFHKVSVSAQRILLLDYDGTLAPFHRDPAKAYPYPNVTEILRQIMAAGKTRLIIISGRKVADLLPMLDLDPMPELWGSHGWERLPPGGKLEQAPLDSDLADILAQAAQIVRSIGLPDEAKAASVAVHWRGLPADQAAYIKQEITHRWQPLTSPGKTEIHMFDGGLELRTIGRDKGFAVRTILAEARDQHAIAAYFGDDLTDEDAFLAMKDSGASFLVRTELRATAADVWLIPPAELLSTLDRWNEVVVKQR